MYTYSNKIRNEIIMKIVEVKSKNGINFMILDSNNEPIIDAVRYLKYLDSVKKSRNTKKTYAYALKKFFIYLEYKEIKHRDVSFDDFDDFVRWMRAPFEYENVLPYNQKESKSSAKTINLTITVVSNFYDYLYRSKKLEVNFYDFLNTKGKHHKKYKSFMHHVNKDYGTLKNILKVKEPKRKLEVLTKAEIKILLEAANNIRDEFLIQLLYETGLRIGEVLSLRIGDIKFDFRKGHQIVLKNRNNSNDSYLKTGERKIFISQSLIDLYDDYVYEIIDDLSICSDYLFVKLKGKNVGEAMHYNDISSLFKRLKYKTSINVHPHLFRHTHATIFYNETKDIKQVQERLGHSNIQTTINLYVHPTEEDIRDDWDKVKHQFQVFNKGE